MVTNILILCCVLILMGETTTTTNAFLRLQPGFAILPHTKNIASLNHQNREETVCCLKAHSSKDSNRNQDPISSSSTTDEDSIQNPGRNWCALPHVELERRDVLLGGAGMAASSMLPLLGKTPLAAAIAAEATSSSSSSSALPPTTTRARSLISIDKHLAIPVWPSWGGGRVIPVSFSNAADPFLLLAHHKHWFDPHDPLRKPFQKFGEMTGLPYIDVEGFAMHPHRGFDILTYVLDGSDGFRHRDSLGGSCTYRGGTAQWMRCGSGVLHEEFWETRPDKRTSIELFQIWVNLPRERKFDEPSICYLGKDTDSPWVEENISYNGRNIMVRNIGKTLEDATAPASTDTATSSGESSSSVVKTRPAVNFQHARLDPGAQWTVDVPPDHSAIMYVREGVASLPGLSSSSSSDQMIVPALQSATFAPHSGDSIIIRNPKRGGGKNNEDILDIILLTGMPLREPLAMGGPIVMNTEDEINDAFRQLSDGTFLDRDLVLRK